MITLEQAKQLERKVGKALTLIDSLKKERDQLRAALLTCRKTQGELEKKCRERDVDTSQIDNVIEKLFGRLDQLEETVGSYEGDVYSQPAAAAVTASRDNAAAAVSRPVNSVETAKLQQIVESVHVHDGTTGAVQKGVENSTAGQSHGRLLNSGDTQAAVNNVANVASYKQKTQELTAEETAIETKEQEPAERKQKELEIF